MPKPKNLWIVNIDAFNINERINIQTVPNELTIDPLSNWAAIPSMGRNNPFYHYTGGEDELRFELDWYSLTENRQDVIQACRWVESLSRNDAYTARAPRVALIWGGLFNNSSWIVTQATYKLTQFEPGNNFLPAQAIQSITLKKVSDINTSREQIRFNQ